PHRADGRRPRRDARLAVRAGDRPREAAVPDPRGRLAAVLRARPGRLPGRADRAPLSRAQRGDDLDRAPLDLAGREPQGADAGGGEHRITRPVALERAACAVEREAVDLDHEPVVAPGEVRLEAERAAVDHGTRDTGAVAEPE